MSEILAIDLEKNNSAVCIFDRGSLKSRFRTVRTRKQLMHDLFVEFTDQLEIVLFETGAQMGWVADILWALNIPFKVADLLPVSGPVRMRLCRVIWPRGILEIEA